MGRRPSCWKTWQAWLWHMQTEPARAKASGVPTRLPHQPRIVPKGLRSFDEHDADFFLELLPGPRDRDGLPESIRFWKTRIEETDPDKTFRVGLDLRPQRLRQVVPGEGGPAAPTGTARACRCTVEAAPEDTELRLLKGLRRRCSQIPADVGAARVLAGIREGLWSPGAGRC